eukprot:gb/GECG01003102.1/.p1 GENE.gb/GECG01003102.1/~~gb/GECG01003102.1/.p1  ORF type:complete len:1267 (+),score=83.95 gb/GECG01003102.1/:1-3801(+)
MKGAMRTERHKKGVNSRPTVSSRSLWHCSFIVALIFNALATSAWAATVSRHRVGPQDVNRLFAQQFRRDPFTNTNRALSELSVDNFDEQVAQILFHEFNVSSPQQFRNLQLDGLVDACESLKIAHTSWNDVQRNGCSLTLANLDYCNGTLEGVVCDNLDVPFVDGSGGVENFSVSVVAELDFSNIHVYGNLPQELHKLPFLQIFAVSGSVRTKIPTKLRGLKLMSVFEIRSSGYMTRMLGVGQEIHVLSSEIFSHWPLLRSLCLENVGLIGDLSFDLAGTLESLQVPNNHLRLPPSTGDNTTREGHAFFPKQNLRIKNLKVLDVSFNPLGLYLPFLESQLFTEESKLKHLNLAGTGSYGPFFTSLPRSIETLILDKNGGQITGTLAHPGLAMATNMQTFRCTECNLGLGGREKSSQSLFDMFNSSIEHWHHLEYFVLSNTAPTESTLGTTVEPNGWTHTGDTERNIDSGPPPSMAPFTKLRYFRCNSCGIREKVASFPPPASSEEPGYISVHFGNDSSHNGDAILKTKSFFFRYSLLCTPEITYPGIVVASLSSLNRGLPSCKCPQGWFGQDGACIPCPSSATTQGDGATSLRQCLCGKGQHARPVNDSVGATALLSEEGGTWFSCDDCPQGTFKSSPKHDECAVCPPHSTSSPGATSRFQCLCEPGYVVSSSPQDELTCVQCGANHFKALEGFQQGCSVCPVGTFSGRASASCSPCATQGVKCQNGTVSLVPGWWQRPIENKGSANRELGIDPSRPFHRCPNPFACRVGDGQHNCSKGYRGTLCGECNNRAGYVKVTPYRCWSCFSDSWKNGMLFMGILTVVSGAVFGLVWWHAQVGRHTRSVIVRIFAQYLQLLVVVVPLATNGRDNLAASILSIEQDLGYFFLKCAITPSFAVGEVLRLSVPIFWILVCAATCLCAKWLRWTGDAHWIFFHCLVTFYYLYVWSIVRWSIVAFHCEEFNGLNVMRSHPEIYCSSGEYIGVVSMWGFALLICLVAGQFFIMRRVYRCYMNGVGVSDIRSLGFVIRGFIPVSSKNAYAYSGLTDVDRVYWWWPAVIVTRFLLVMILREFVTDVRECSVAILLCLLGYLSLQIHCRPYFEHIHNVIESGSILVLLLIPATIISSPLDANLQSIPDTKHALVWSIQVAYSLLCLAAMVYVGWSRRSSLSGTKFSAKGGQEPVVSGISSQSTSADTDGNEVFILKSPEEVRSQDELLRMGVDSATSESENNDDHCSETKSYEAGVQVGTRSQYLKRKLSTVEESDEEPT